MVEKNLSFKMASAAVEAIGSLNNPRSIELHKKMLFAYKENESTAKSYKNKAFPHGLSAIVSPILNALGTALKAKHSFGDIFCSIAKATPEAVRIWDSSLDGDITTHSHLSKQQDNAYQRINSQENTADGLIGRISEYFGRMLGKETI